MIEKYQVINGELQFLKISENNKGVFKKNGERKRLSKNEIQEIIKLYPDYFNWQLARMFNVSESNILSLKRKYDLKKSHELMDACRFEKGHIPFNKGKSHDYPNSGQFIKGHTPKNHRPVGSIRNSYKHKNPQYFEIKIVEHNRWKLLHRYIWEQHNGEIPKGNIIIFEDGNTSNIDISNLRMITRRENLIRNRNRGKASRSLKETWRKEKQRVKYGLPQLTKFKI